MEYFEVLDELGNKTGEIKERELVHKDGNWHRAVHIWIINDLCEILLQKRSAKKENHPNMWHVSCAGHIVSKDDNIETVIKEIKEELGIDVNKEEIEFLFTIKEHNIAKMDYIENEFKDIFIIRKNVDIKDIVIDLEEVSEVKYVSIEEFKKMSENQNSNVVVPRYINEFIEMLKTIRKQVNKNICKKT